MPTSRRVIGRGGTRSGNHADFDADDIYLGAAASAG